MKLLSRWVPADLLQGPQRFHAQLLLVLISLGICTNVGVWIAHIAEGGEAGWVIILATVLMHGVPLALLLLRKQIALVSWFMVIAICLSLIGFVLLSGGISSPSLMPLMVGPILGMALLGRSVGAALGLGYLLLIGVLWMVGPMAPVFAGTSQDAAVSLGVTAFYSLLALWFIARSREAVYDELAERNAELDTVNRELERALGAKAAFFNMMSHELRTPMNGVLGMAMLLEDDGLTPAQHEHLEMLRASGEHLLELLDRILEVSRHGESPIRYSPRSTDVCALLSPIVARRQILACEKGLGLALSCQGEEVRGAQVEVDVKLVGRVLAEWVDNAIKFTSAGQVLVISELRGASVRVSVQDSGMGITESYLSQAFEPFTQIDDGMNRMAAGTGLGLAISERLLVAMGLPHGVESTPGAGSTFWVELPLTSEEAQAREGSCAKAVG